MKKIDTIENIKKLGLDLYIISDCQEWEAIEGIDYNLDDIVEYKVLSNEDKEYILITKKGELIWMNLNFY